MRNREFSIIILSVRRTNFARTRVVFKDILIRNENRSHFGGPRRIHELISELYLNSRRRFPVGELRVGPVKDQNRMKVLRRYF